MRAVVLAAVVALSAGLAAAVIGCIRFNEEPMRTVTTDSGVTGAETPETMCDRYGGFPVVEKAMADLIPKLTADCRVDRFFVTMPPERVAHMRECMALQLGSIMRCSRDGVRVKYPAVDSKGEQCRDMKGSHQALGIHADDFNAMIDDILAVLAEAKVAAEDVAAIADILRFQSTDIVNPGDAGRGDACASETSAPVDTGIDDY